MATNPSLLSSLYRIYTAKNPIFIPLKIPFFRQKSHILSHKIRFRAALCELVQARTQLRNPLKFQRKLP